jgi:type I restriction-modification system DNA methylase subunit
MPTIDNVIKHARERPYMSGIDRDKLRVKATSEIFTPTELVQQILDQLPVELFKDSTKTFCDPSCGDGQFLSEVLIRKMQNGIDFETALRNIYGVDIMQDNIDLCKERLLCNRHDLQHVVDKNIVCADGLKYDYLFGEREIIVGFGILEMPA